MANRLSEALHELGMIVERVQPPRSYYSRRRMPPSSRADRCWLAMATGAHGRSMGQHRGEFLTGGTNALVTHLDVDHVAVHEAITAVREVA